MLLNKTTLFIACRLTACIICKSSPPCALQSQKKQESVPVPMSMMRRHAAVKAGDKSMSKSHLQEELTAPGFGCVHIPHVTRGLLTDERISQDTSGMEQPLDRRPLAKIGNSSRNLAGGANVTPASETHDRSQALQEQGSGHMGSAGGAHLCIITRLLLHSRSCSAADCPGEQRPSLPRRQKLPGVPEQAASQDAMRLPSAPTPPEMSQAQTGNLP